MDNFGQDIDPQEYWPSHWLKADMLPEDRMTLTIRGIGSEKDPKGKLHVVAAFQEFDGPVMDMNKTNFGRLEKLFGKKTSLWAGKRFVMEKQPGQRPDGTACTVLRVVGAAPATLVKSA